METMSEAAVMVPEAVRPVPHPPTERKSPDGKRRGLPRGYSASFAFAASVPMTALYTLMIAVPTVLAVLLSLTSWNAVGMPQWVGLENWITFFTDAKALRALGGTLGLAVACLVLQLPLSMALGLFIAGGQKYRYVYSVVFVLPMLVSGVGLSLMWAGMLYPKLGALAYIANTFNMPFLIQDWFGNPAIARFVVLAIITWLSMPVHMLIFQHGRRSIPDVLYESARIDGASGARQFFSITVPMMRQTIALNCALIVVSSLTTFDVIYVLTGGGPGETTNVLAIEMYKLAFQQNNFGYAAVFAVMLAVLGISAGALIMAISGFNRFESEQEGIA
jgi:raffinose/stachyose/melibiose transport system permease protein